MMTCIEHQYRVTACSCSHFSDWWDAHVTLVSIIPFFSFGTMRKVGRWWGGSCWGCRVRRAILRWNPFTQITIMMVAKLPEGWTCQKTTRKCGLVPFCRIAVSMEIKKQNISFGSFMPPEHVPLIALNSKQSPSFVATANKICWKLLWILQGNYWWITVPESLLRSCLHPTDPLTVEHGWKPHGYLQHPAVNPHLWFSS